MKLRINLKDLEFYAFHGVLPLEQQVGNIFKVNLSVGIPSNVQIENDDLSATVSYAEMFEIVKEEMLKPKKLLEKVALSVAQRIRQRWPQMEEGEIEIEKLTPPISGITGSASVKLIF